MALSHHDLLPIVCNWRVRPTRVVAGAFQSHRIRVSPLLHAFHGDFSPPDRSTGFQITRILIDQKFNGFINLQVYTSCHIISSSTGI